MTSGQAHPVFDHRVLPQRVLFGTRRAAHHVASALDSLAARRPVLIASPASAGAAAGLFATASAPVLSWTETAQHVPADLAARAEAAVRGADEADAIVVVGGGSAIGLGKAVAVATGLPLVAVPTTYSGSESTPVWAVSEAGVKRTASDPRALPAAIVFDAALSERLPLGVSVPSGLNALAHAVGSLWGPRADPLSDAAALNGATLLLRGLRGVVADDGGIAAREDLLLGSRFAASAFAAAGSSLQHTLAHTLAAGYGLDHARTHAVLLRYVLALHLHANPAPKAALLDAIGGKVPFVTLSFLYRQLEAPTSLRELGMLEEALDDAVTRALAAAPAPSSGQPEAVDQASLTALLRAAWAGEEPAKYAESLAG